MADHDVERFASSLSAKLATRSRHVALFLGAGAGRACGLPDIASLEQDILERLEPDDERVIRGLLTGRNLEEVLSRLRRIAALVSGAATVDGLTADAAAELDRRVCACVVAALDVAEADLNPVRHLAAWAKRAGYHLPVELFTVNYDLLIETGLEELRVPFFDGFVGSLRARFHTDLVEQWPPDVGASMSSAFVRLWKLHGSVNWAWASGSEIVRLGTPVSTGQAAAIYPSDTKYEESRRVPFVVLQDRFRRALHQPETLVLISGYSFGDNHLNELLFDAALRRERSELIAFCYSEIPSVLAETAERTPNLQAVGPAEAIIGGIRAPWSAPTESLEGIWLDGKLALGNFALLAAHLARSADPEPGFAAVPPLK
ncbi:MAG: SIR2 family protein [Solirubrobacteraceae bacterium]